MANIKLGGTTLATESSGAITFPAGTLGSGVIYPTGHVINSVYSSNDYEISYTGDTSVHEIESSSGVDWVASITTSSTSNHILVMTTMHFTGGASGIQDNRGHIHGLLDKNGAGYAQVYNGYYGVGVYDYGGSGIFSNLPYNHIFRVSPNFVGICNFKFTITANHSSSILKFNYPSTTQESNIILMEIKG